MPEPWKTEYHVKRDDEAFEWFSDRAKAIAKAEAETRSAQTAAITVDEVRYYFEDRRQIWPAEGE